MDSPKYRAERRLVDGVETMRLTDSDGETVVSILPSLGNRAFEMLVGGQNILHFPFGDLAEAMRDRHLNGIPFLGPWANRMPEGFHANGRFYRFDASFESIRPDANGIPIHGLLTASPLWEVSDLGADDSSAWVTSSLEFWRHPELMANWPFAHEYRMTYRLTNGTLEVALAVRNLSAEPMPLAVGFHPYFRIPGVSIEDTLARIPVRRHVETDARLVATGETTPVSFGETVSLKEHRFDDGFTDLVRGADGSAAFSVEGGGRKISVQFGPKYTVAIVYAPAGQNFICFEPMTAVTNGVNLAHEGRYDGLQSIPAGREWSESFTIAPEGAR